MGIFFVYILKSSVCLVVFYLFYRLLLSRETFHRFNRVALLSILLLSCLLPLVEVTVEEQTEVHQTMMTLEQWLMLADMMNTADTTDLQAEEVTVTWIQVALLVYLAGILLFALRNGYSLLKLGGLLKSGRKENLSKYIDGGEKVTLIVHDRDIAPFSWMKCIVISEKIWMRMVGRYLFMNWLIFKIGIHGTYWWRISVSSSSGSIRLHGC